MYTNVDDLLKSLYTRVASKSDRSRIHNALEALHNPHLDLKTIQIAGTNGKGSTTNYVSHILMSEGYKVGTFTSPHLIVHNDRIRVNNKNISNDDLLRLANKYMPIFDKYGLNMFEIDFILAVYYFLEQNVDYAIFEAGMGGRLDATTELSPMVSCITNIGMDHIQFLGNSLEAIAKEKAGILKPNVTCITSESKSGCIDVFNKKAMEIGSKIKVVQPLEVVECPNLKLQYNELVLCLKEVGLYQRYNAASALGIIEELRTLGISISDESIIEGFKHPWAGRFEKVLDNPAIYVDGAHNNEGVKELCETIRAYHMPTYIVFAALKDKPVEGMLQALKEESEEVVVTTFENKRSSSKNDYPGGYQFFEDYVEAIDYLKSKNGLLIITGSLYFVSLIKEYFNK